MMHGQMSAMNHEELSLEVTVLSAESLKNPSCPLLPGRRLRPYVSLRCAAEAATTSSNDDCQYQQRQKPLYRTRVDEGGARNPAWGDTICLPLHPSFLRAATTSCGANGAGGRNEDAAAAGVIVTVLSRRALRPPARLGWCRISPFDVLDGIRPASMKRRLSYALRSPQHGGRGHGIVHVAVRLLGAHLDRLVASSMTAPPAAVGWERVAVGIPVARQLPTTETAPMFARSSAAAAALTPLNLVVSKKSTLY